MQQRVDTSKNSRVSLPQAGGNIAHLSRYASTHVVKFRRKYFEVRVYVVVCVFVCICVKVDLNAIMC